MPTPPPGPSPLRDALLALLGAEHPSHGFARAVATQLLAAGRSAPAAVASVAELLGEGAVAPDAAAQDAAALLADPPLFAAAFQNVDLLFLASSPHADTVASRVMRALELAAAREGA